MGPGRRLRTHHVYARSWRTFVGVHTTGPAETIGVRTFGSSGVEGCLPECVTSAPVASLLGVRRPTDQGHVIVGAHALGRALAHALQRAGEDVVLIDTNASAARAAEDEGLRVIYGNATNETVLVRADIEGRRTFTALTTNESTNLLLARRAKEHFKVSEVFAALEHTNAAVGPEQAREVRVGVLFGEPLDIADWIHAFRHDQAEVRRFRAGSQPQSATARKDGRPEDSSIPPLVVVRDGRATPVSSETPFRAGDVGVFVVRRTDEVAALPAGGEWDPIDGAGTAT